MNLKFNFFTGLLIIFVFISCSNKNIVESRIDTRQHFVIRPWEYSENHFFIDSVYFDPALNIFENYYNNQTPVVNEFYHIKEITICQTYTGLINPEEIRSNIFFELQPISPEEKYPESLREEYNDSTAEIQARMIELKEGEDYLINKYTGLITILNIPANFENRCLGVAYKIEGPSTSDEDDITYGEFDFSHSKGEFIEYPIILKMIKYKQNWNTALYEKANTYRPRNIYNIGYNHISSDKFSFNIYFVTDDKKDVSYYNGHSLLNLFGFDSNDDQMFDFKKDVTIIPESGDIIFPMLQPFGDDLPDLFDSRYQINSIYSGEKEEAMNDSNAVRFYFPGKFIIE